MTSNEQYQMPLYRLKKDIPLARAGTIFYYDENDSRLGSIARGCLKMAWTKDGDCQNALCADTIVFHAEAINDTEWFEPLSVPTSRFVPAGVALNGEPLYRRLTLAASGQEEK